MTVCIAEGIKHDNMCKVHVHYTYVQVCMHSAARNQARLQALVHCIAECLLLGSLETMLTSQRQSARHIHIGIHKQTEVVSLRWYTFHITQ